MRGGGKNETAWLDANHSVLSHKLGVYPIPDIARLEWWLDVDERFKKWEQEDARRRGK
jgi:hypothetical protein